MLPTYKATLRGNVLEWEGDAPGRAGAVSVHVTILESSAPTTADDPDRGRRMAEVLGRIAARGGLSGVADPIAWEREVREDRPMPGREP